MIKHTSTLFQIASKRTSTIVKPHNMLATSLSQHKAFATQFFEQQRKFSTTPLRKQEKQQEQQQPSKEEKKPEEKNWNPNVAKIEQLQKDLDAKNARIKELEQKVLYALADQENTRRIAKQDVEKSSKFATSGFAKSLIDVADNLARALETSGTPEVQQLLTERPDAKSTKLLKIIFQGVEMTNTNLHKIFVNNGVTKIESSVGTPFDPKFHDGLQIVPLQGTAKPNTVAMLIKQGYTMHERVLRPSAVAVYEDNEEPTTQEAEEKKE